MKKYDKICTECLEEMFRRVGLEYPDEELTSKENWYTLHVWTKEEEDSFREWMLKKLKRHRLMRAELEVEMFLLQWGWKVEDYERKGIDEM